MIGLVVNFDLALLCGLNLSFYLCVYCCWFRLLRVLEVVESLVEPVSEDEVDWVSCFPETQTHLESLVFDCVEYQVNFEALEGLVARSPGLKKLRLNRFVSMPQLYRLMLRAPQLTHLGTGSFSDSEAVEQEPDYASAFAACRSLVCLSGFREIWANYLPAILPVCANLTSLNLSYADVNADQLRSVICHCRKLQILWVCAADFVLCNSYFILKSSNRDI